MAMGVHAISSVAASRLPGLFRTGSGEVYPAGAEATVQGFWRGKFSLDMASGGGVRQVGALTFADRGSETSRRPFGIFESG